MAASATSVLRHLPNALGLLRIALAFPIAWLIVNHHPVDAAAWFVLAGLTDVLDGWLAKRFHWQSQFGGWLDPIADKTLVLAACVALSWHGDLPWWLLGLIALRDLVIVGGAMAFHFRFASLHAEPTLLGKATTFTMVLLVVYLLASNVWGEALAWVTTALYALTAALLVASGADYVRRWGARARQVRGDRR